MKRYGKKLLALILVIAMLTELVPAVFAENNQEVPTETQTVDTTKDIFVTDRDDTTAEELQSAEIQFEDVSLREENVKHFRLENGAYLAVVYDTPVHYQDANGTWQEYDNTLNPESQGKDTFYEVKNGESLRCFSAQANDDGLLMMQRGAYRLSLAPVQEGTSIRPVQPKDPIVAESSTEETAEPTEEETSEAFEPSEPEEPSSEFEADTAESTEAEATEATEPEETSEETSAPMETTEEPTTPEESTETTISEEAPEESTGAAAPAEEFAVAKILSTAAPAEEEISDALMAKVQPQKLYSALEYPKALDGATLRYENYANSVKESIIVAAPQEDYRYTFRLETEGLTPALQGDSSIALSTEDGSVIYTIPAPYMMDANDEVSYDAIYTLTNTGDAWLLTVTASSEWMDDPSRAYPVVIDPTVTETAASDADICGAYVRSGYPSSPNTSDTGLYVGNNGSADANTRSYFHVNKLPTLPVGCEIIYADFSIYQYAFTRKTNGATSLDVGLYGLTKAGNLTAGSAVSSWQSWANGLTWTQATNGTTAHDSTIIDRQTLSSSTSYSYVTWDITKLAYKWYDRENGNLGFMLMPTSGDNATARATLYGPKKTTNRPRMTIAYRNISGIESQYTYQTANIGRAGTSYISDFSMQNTLVVPIFSSPSNVMPFSVSLIYNSSTAGAYFSSGYNGVHTKDFSNMIIGTGWKLSLQETVVSLSVGGTTYLVYNDADGTEHYFQKTATNTYQDEDGLGLKITVSGSNYTMADDYGNSRIFTNGYLTETKDAYGNALYYCYDGNAYSASSTTWKPTASGAHKITSVVRKNVGVSTTEQLLLIGYNGNRVSTIISECNFDNDTEKTAHRTQLLVSTSNNATQLTSIKFPDGQEAQYSYFPSSTSGTGFSSSMRMKTAYDAEAKYGIEYSYSYNSDVYHIFEYIKNGSTTEYGTKLHGYKRSHLQTVYRYYGNDGIADKTDDGKANGGHNDDVLTFKVLDSFGRTVTSYSTDFSEEHVLGAGAASYTKNSGTSKANNRMTANISAGQQGINLLKNSGAENGTTNWTNATTSTAAHYVGRQAFVMTSAKTFYQTVQLTSGQTYTFSAYVNTKSMNSAGSVKLAIQNSSGTTLANSETVNYSTTGVSDGWMRLTVSYKAASSTSHRFAVISSGSTTGTIYVDALQLEQEEAASTYNLVEDSSFEGGNISGSSVFGWYKTGGTTVTTETSLNLTYFGTKMITLTGASGAQRINQNIKLNVPLDTTFLFSGWGKADANPHSVPEKSADSDPYFGLIIRLHYSDNTSEAFYFPFDVYYNDWQYVEGIVAPKKTGNNITITEAAIVASYDYNFNTARIDNLSLRMEPAQTYSYDANGNLTSAAQTKTGKDTAQYSGVDMTKYTSSNKVAYTYTYNGKHDVSTAAAAGITNTYTYDTSGNMLTSKLTGSGTSEYLYSESTVTPDRNSTASVTDTNGDTTTYTYNGYTGQVTSTKNAKGITTNYTYFDGNNRAKQTYLTNYASILYDYSNGALSSLTRKTYQTPGDNHSTQQYQRYGFTQDKWGRTSAITVSGSTDGKAWGNSRTLASYSYYGYNTTAAGASAGALQTMTYGNGETVTYTYDSLDRVSKIKYSSGRYIEYTYNAENALAELRYGDGSTLEGKYVYEYDGLGRLIRSNEYDGSGNLIQRTEHQYDANDRLTAQGWAIGDTAYQETYAYDDPGKPGATSTSDGSLKQMVTGTGEEISFTYDGLRRLHGKAVTFDGVDLFTTRYGYRSISGNLTSSQIKYYNVVNGGLDSDSVIEGAQYTYDANNNITQIAKSTSPYYPLVKYEYDLLNQLTKETHYDGKGTGSSHITATYEYTYDAAGNLLSEKKDGVTTKTYTYGDSGWNDLLTKFNGKSISYDAIGNPTSYTSNGKDWTLSWTDGRSLSSTTNIVVNQKTTTTSTVNFAYDADGIRTQKVWKQSTKMNSGETPKPIDPNPPLDPNVLVGPPVQDVVQLKTHNYITQNGKIVRETIENNGKTEVLDFLYDEQGKPFALNYSTNGGKSFSTYYYILNLQGDVVKLVWMPVSGDHIFEYVEVASYTYNAWGELLSSSGTMADENPLRYRGYYYDYETGFYYLQSRYYDPATHRFINADAPEYSEMAAYSLNDSNLFVYCGNNPVTCEDEDGEFWNFIIGAVVGAVVNAVTTAIDSYVNTGSVDWGSVAISAGVGAVNGAVAASGLGAITQAGISAATSFVGTAATEVHKQVSERGLDSITWKDVGNIAAKSTISATVSFGTSIAGTAFGKMATSNLENSGKGLIMKGGFRYAGYTKRQLASFVAKGKKIVNTARGINSVIGTVFTWPTNSLTSITLK